MAGTKLLRFLLCLVLFVSAGLTVWLFFAPHFSTSKESSPSKNPLVVYIIGAVPNPVGVKIESGAEMTVLKALARPSALPPEKSSRKSCATLPAEPRIADLWRHFEVLWPVRAVR